MAFLPTTEKPLPLSVYGPFVECAARCAKLFCEDPSELNYRNFVDIVKAGLVPGLRQGAKVAAERLEQWPDVIWPSPNFHNGLTTPAPILAQRKVEQGHFSTAARCLADDGGVATITDEVIVALKVKHPDGVAEPFHGIGRGSSTNSPLPLSADVLAQLYKMKHDTSSGLSGWTVPLLKIATTSPFVVDFLHTLTGLIASGTAPARDFILTSALTPLLKPDGGVRPIAGGEVIYRVCAKALLAKNFRADMVAPSQLGVGSSGGVEPIIRLLQLAVDDQLGKKYSHIADLDFWNAFNALHRKLMANGARDFSPELFSAIKFSYRAATPLIVRKPDDIVRLQSSEGARQGDPFSALVFSVAVRPMVEQLIETLGPEYVVVAYLDNFYVLGPDDQVLNKVVEIIRSSPSPLKLNESKCKLHSIQDIRERGTEILGTCIGPAPARAAFLEKQIDVVKAKLNKLVGLPLQHASLILRICYQSNLRHLQRTLKPDGIEHVFRKLDDVIYAAFVRLRGGPGPTAQEEVLDRRLVSLPLKLGGIGILSYEHCSPHAYAASNDLSDLTLSTFVHSINAPSHPVSQRERCMEMWRHQKDETLETLGEEDQLRLTENASSLGRLWLAVVPYNQQMKLSDHEVQAGLHARTLKKPNHHCPKCGAPFESKHFDYCGADNTTITSRHESMKYAAGRALASIPGVVVEYEPNIGGTTRRNDIRITGSFESGVGCEEFDVGVVSLGTVRAGRAARFANVRGAVGATEVLMKRIEHVLEEVAEGKKARLPMDPNRQVTFHPMLMTAGGFLHSDLTALFKRWKKVMGKGAFEHMKRVMAVRLVRHRGRVVSLASTGAVGVQPEEDGDVDASAAF